MQSFEKLEKEFGDWIGNPNCVAVSSGTSALHLALEVMKLDRPRDRRPNVVVPEFTMVACARAVTLAGLTPVFIDCGEDLNLNPTLLKENLWLNSCGVMAVHIYGRRCDMDSVHETTKSRDGFVIEDLAEAHGVLPHPDTDAACWSFYKNKIIHGEEGGMIAFKSSLNAERAKSLRSLGFTAEHDFRHYPRGINARMSNLHAKPILRSLRWVVENLKLRRDVADVYDTHTPTEWKMPARDVDWVYDIRIPGLKELHQSMIIKECLALGIQARYGFKPMSFQAEYSSPNSTATKAYRLSREVIYLPVREDMGCDEARKNMEALITVAGL